MPIVTNAQPIHRSVMGIPAIQRPRSNSREVRVSRLSRDLVDAREDELDMLPVLHQEHIGLFHDDDLDRRQEVAISLGQP